ncbi:hypothetical protein D3C73_1189630 [compost metagenome]
MFSQRSLVRRQLGDKQAAVLEDLHRQALMALWIEAVKPGAQHRQRHTARCQGLLVTDAINAQRQSGGDRQTALHQFGTQTGCVVLACIGGVTGSHHRQLWQRKGCEIPAAIEQQGGGGDLFEQRGIGGTVRAQQVIVRCRGPVQPLLHQG